MPSLEPSPLRTPASTVAYTSDEPAAVPGPGRLWVAGPSTAERLSADALRSLLRRRLRLAFLVVTGMFTVMGFLAAVANVALHGWAAPPHVWRGFAFFGCLSVA